ncbi:hypothetical protein GGQ85_002947 [Nitrobacter vulgaris]|uniref:hypothetical protein n=1 Tax=Nitrobacter vulgaris TaxID=29421 RepID=UPI00285887C9|nr:hypothetical protein [Nitrobacter vulgaris]MDR6305227.1 hypothetical protein [Nitrobacter vulgaris]
MSHLVCRRGKYWSIEESYRENGKVKKRVLRYLGARRSDDPQIRMQQMLDTAERKAEAIADRQRAEFGETGAERQSRLKEEAKFSSERYLEATCAPPAASESEAASGDNEEAPEPSTGTSIPS